VKPARLLILLLAVLGAGLLPAAPPDGEPGPIRIATWNVRNYLTQNRWHDGAYRFDYPKPEAEKDRLRETIHTVDPDILLLQEFGGEAFLNEFREDLATEGRAYPYSHFQSIPGSRTGLALLSRLPPDETILLVPEPSPVDETRPAIVRGVQEILLRHAGSTIRLFHLHLKSRYTDREEDPESRDFRSAEFQHLARLLEPRLRLAGKTDSLLLAGDFNTPFADPLLDPLRRHWRPLTVTDATGAAWTYYHFKSGRREVIDGFWTRQEAGNPQNESPDGAPWSLRPVGVFPVVDNLPATEDEPSHDSPPTLSDLSSQIGSDHRMVVIEWVPGKGKVQARQP
jgi:endonuclease/exonuclease/phosphatase family metal-dependent hydrolase